MEGGVNCRFLDGEAYEDEDDEEERSLLGSNIFGSCNGNVGILFFSSCWNFQKCTDFSFSFFLSFFGFSSFFASLVTRLVPAATALLRIEAYCTK